MESAVESLSSEEDGLPRPGAELIWDPGTGTTHYCTSTVRSFSRAAAVLCRTTVPEMGLAQ